jgi:hypothetical protein
MSLTARTGAPLLTLLLHGCAGDGQLARTCSNAAAPPIPMHLLQMQPLAGGRWTLSDPTASLHGCCRQATGAELRRRTAAPPPAGQLQGREQQGNGVGTDATRPEHRPVCIACWAHQGAASGTALPTGTAQARSPSDSWLEPPAPPRLCARPRFASSARAEAGRRCASSWRTSASSSTAELLRMRNDSLDSPSCTQEGSRSTGR